jgi:hypothetical protein
VRQVRDSRRFIQMLGDLLLRGYPVRFRAEGRSMFPAIRDGQMITVEPIGRRPVRIGDVVLYRHGRAAIAHRVVRVRSSAGGIVELLLRGDAAGACDAPVAPGQVLGRVVAVERAGSAVRRGVMSGAWSRILGCVMRGAHAARQKIMMALAPLLGRT